MASKRKAASVPLTDDGHDEATTRISPRRTQISKDWEEILAAQPLRESASKTATTSGSASKNVATIGEEGSDKARHVSNSNPMTGRSPASTTSPNKKRPYRRTKRPVNYNDKSTITVSTPAAMDAPNVYDAVLGESEDLLRAASEAQCLGRLKMASNYLLLLHTRLVGLGKRFDRSKITAPSLTEETTLKPTKLDMSLENTTISNHSDEVPKQQVSNQSPERATRKDETKTPTKPRVTPRNGISEAALNQLTNYLPKNIELDQAMVEHLARAAAELHQKRTGRRANTEEGLLNSPAMNTEEVFHYNKEIKDKDSSSSSPTRKQWKKIAQQASVWSEEEQAKLKDALRTTSDPAKIAQLMGTRTEAQVTAYLKSVAELEAMEKEMLETPRKRGGRGRKPPTTAINTVPNANLDAKSMLGGGSVI